MTGRRRTSAGGPPRAWSLIFSAVVAAGLGSELRAQESEPVVVATKVFAESYILGEMFAQLLESRGITVDRRPGLGATEIVFEALRQDEVDVYPVWQTPFDRGCLEQMEKTMTAAIEKVLIRN